MCIDLVMSYLIFGRQGCDDYQGIEAMMFEALDKVEKQLKKPLMLDDKKGMDLMKAEQEVIYKKYDLRHYIFNDPLNQLIRYPADLFELF